MQHQQADQHAVEDVVGREELDDVGGVVGGAAEAARGTHCHVCCTLMPSPASTLTYYEANTNLLRGSYRTIKTKANT